MSGNLSIARFLSYEETIQNLSKDVRKLIEISQQHGLRIKELLVTSVNSVSQVEFMTALTTTRFQQFNLVKNIQQDQIKAVEDHEADACEVKETKQIQMLKDKVIKLEKELQDSAFRFELESQKFNSEIKQSKKGIMEMKHQLNKSEDEYHHIIRTLYEFGVNIEPYSNQNETSDAINKTRLPSFRDIHSLEEKSPEYHDGMDENAMSDIDPTGDIQNHKPYIFKRVHTHDSEDDRLNRTRSPQSFRNREINPDEQKNDDPPIENKMDRQHFTKNEIQQLFRQSDVMKDLPDKDDTFFTSEEKIDRNENEFYNIVNSITAAVLKDANYLFDLKVADLKDTVLNGMNYLNFETPPSSQRLENGEGGVDMDDSIHSKIITQDQLPLTNYQEKNRLFYSKLQTMKNINTLATNISTEGMQRAISIFDNISYDKYRKRATFDQKSLYDHRDEFTQTTTMNGHTSKSDGAQNHQFKNLLHDIEPIESSMSEDFFNIQNEKDLVRVPSNSTRNRTSSIGKSRGQGDRSNSMSSHPSQRKSTSPKEKKNVTENVFKSRGMMAIKPTEVIIDVVAVKKINKIINQKKIIHQMSNDIIIEKTEEIKDSSNTILNQYHLVEEEDMKIKKEKENEFDLTGLLTATSLILQPGNQPLKSDIQLQSTSASTDTVLKGSLLELESPKNLANSPNLFTIKENEINVKKSNPESPGKKLNVNVKKLSFNDSQIDDPQNPVVFDKVVSVDIDQQETHELEQELEGVAQRSVAKDFALIPELNFDHKTDFIHLDHHMDSKGGNVVDPTQIKSKIGIEIDDELNEKFEILSKQIEDRVENWMGNIQHIYDERLVALNHVTQTNMNQNTRIMTKINTLQQTIHHNKDDIKGLQDEIKNLQEKYEIQLSNILSIDNKISIACDPFLQLIEKFHEKVDEVEIHISENRLYLKNILKSIEILKESLMKEDVPPEIKRHYIQLYEVLQSIDKHPGSTKEDLPIIDKQSVTSVDEKMLLHRNESKEQFNKLLYDSTSHLPTAGYVMEKSIFTDVEVTQLLKQLHEYSHLYKEMTDKMESITQQMHENFHSKSNYKTNNKMIHSQHHLITVPSITNQYLTSTHAVGLFTQSEPSERVQNHSMMTSLQTIQDGEFIKNLKNELFELFLTSDLSENIVIVGIQSELNKIQKLLLNKDKGLEVGKQGGKGLPTIEIPTKFSSPKKPSSNQLMNSISSHGKGGIRQVMDDDIQLHSPHSPSLTMGGKGLFDRSHTVATARVMTSHQSHRIIHSSPNASNPHFFNPLVRHDHDEPMSVDQYYKFDSTKN